MGAPVMRRLCHAILVVAVLFVSAAFWPSLATGEQRVKFLDEAALVFELRGESLLPERHPVVVLVQEVTETTRVRLEVLGAVAGSIAIAPQDPLDVSDGRAEFTVSGGDMLKTGTATLVATTSDGAAARRDLTIKSPDAPPKLWPPSISMRGTHWVPFLDDVHVRPYALAGEEAAATARPIGLVASTNGHSGTATLKGGAVTVRGVNRAGEYTGKVDFDATTDKGEVPITVKVRDFIFWPALLLFFGLCLVYLLDLFDTVRRPASRLAIRLNAARERAQKKRATVLDELRRTLGEAGLTNIGLPLVSKSGGTELVLDAAARNAYADWIASSDAAERKEWEFGGEKLKGFVTTTENYVGALSRITDEAPMYAEAKRVSNALPLSKLFADSPVVRDYVDLLRNTRFTESSTLDDFQKNALSSATNIRVVARYLRALSALHGKAKGDKAEKVLALSRQVLNTTGSLLGDLQKAIDDLRNEIDAPPAQVKKDLDAVEGLLADSLISARYLTVQISSPFLYEYRVEGDPSDVASIADAGMFLMRSDAVAIARDAIVADILRSEGAVEVGAVPVGRSVYVLSSSPEESDLLELSDVVGLLPPTELDTSTRSSDMMAALKKSEQSYYAIGAVLTFLAGLAAQYFPNPTFGSAADYLGVFLWASVFGATAQFASKYLARP